MSHERYRVWIDGSYDVVSGRAGAGVILEHRGDGRRGQMRAVIGHPVTGCPDILNAECAGLYTAVRAVCGRFPQGKLAVTICTDRIDLLRVVEMYWEPNALAKIALSMMERQSDRITWSIEKVDRADNWLADLVANAARKGYDIPTVQAVQQFRRVRRVNLQQKEQAS